MDPEGAADLPAPGSAAERRAGEDEVLVEALARGLSYEEAGAFAGLVGRTVSRRMADAEFRRRVSVRRAAVVSEQTGLLVSGSSEAITTIQQEMRSAPRPADRLRAASLLLTLALRFRQGFELETRLQEVEARLGLGATASDTPDPANDDLDEDG